MNEKELLMTGNVSVLNEHEIQDKIKLTKLLDSTSKQKIWMYTLALALSNAADAVEIMCIGYILANFEEGITIQEKELLSASSFVGMLIGGIFCGLLSDVVGRKPCLLGALSINAVAGFLSAFALTTNGLIVMRVIGGIGIGGSIPTVFTIGAEIFPSVVRGELLTVVASFWMVGSIFVGLTAWLMLGDDFSGQRISPALNWRHFAMVCSIPAAVAFLMVALLVPESPRFLVSRGELKRAMSSLSSMTGLQQQLTSPNRAYEVKDSSAFDRAPLGSSLMSLLRPPLLPITLTMAVTWFCLCFGTYGISTWITILFNEIGLGNPYACTFIYALANLPGNILSIALVNRLGRRRLMLVGMTVATVASASFALTATQPFLVVLFASVFNAAGVMAWNALDCLSVESFPTNVRTSAMGVLTAVGRVGAVVAQFVNGSLQTRIPLMLAVTSFAMLIGGASTCFSPLEVEAGLGSGASGPNGDEADSTDPDCDDDQQDLVERRRGRL